MSLLNHLTELASEAFEELGLPGELGEVLPSSRPDLAQFQCNGAMQAAAHASRPPREIAEDVARVLAGRDEIEAAEVAGPGFINIDLTPVALSDWVMRSADHRSLGFHSDGQEKSVLVDYGGPNVAKAMHAGHLRATIIGDSLARLFDFAGHDVTRDAHFGDWGFQMGLLLVALEDHGLSPGEIALEDLQRIYPEAVSRSNDDPAFADRARSATVALQQGDEEAVAKWRAMKGVSEVSQREDFSALGVEFDLWYGESDVAARLNSLVAGLEESGVGELSDGALVIHVQEPGDEREWPPLILRTTAGGFLYGTTDLATLEMRVRDMGIDLILYVVDHRQSDHFTQLFRAARKSGIAGDAVELEHVGIGTMNGPDGRPFKTREGGVVRLRDVITLVTDAARERLDEARLATEYDEDERGRIAQQVGIAALKFGDLINNRASSYKFDLERFSSFEGKTGPYLQYACVRIRSILRKAGRLGPGVIMPPAADVERDLMLELIRFPEAVERSIELRAPNHLAEFAYELAVAWNKFYDKCHILSEPEEARRRSWLGLGARVGRTLETSLSLLGIPVPERM